MPSTQPNQRHLEGDAERVLAHHGKSFHFAGRLLDQHTLRACATLYHFCRYADDLVDEATNAVEAKEKLNQLRADIELDDSRNATVNAFLALSETHLLDKRVTIELLSGLAGDLDVVAFKNETELLRYCYRVAGTVGLHMCSIFDVRDSHALRHAIDLGIAMQLTNICRDVLEDAQNNRRYLPTSLVGELSAKEILRPNHVQQNKIRRTVAHLLKQADEYYESANQGLTFLPGRVRLAIAVASRVYREIGIGLTRRNFDVWQGRVVVSKAVKYKLAALALMGQLATRRGHSHQASLHRLLVGMPHANA